MLKSFSTYYLDIVDASNCDYNSYDYLGLKCPFCDSIVYLHASSTRLSKGREISVKAYFAHAKIDPSIKNPKEREEVLSCEARSTSSQGQDFIEKLRIEAKGQRSVIYNESLWDLFANSRKITKDHIDSITTEFGNQYCKESTKLVRAALKKDSKILYRLIPEMISSSQQSNATKALELITNSKTAKEQVLKQTQYLAECDVIHHVRVAQEILAFLSTNSGNYALEKILKTTLYFIQTTTNESPQVIKKFSPPDLAKMLTGMIAGTHWVTAINFRKFRV